MTDHTPPAFRRPLPPAPIECYELVHPAVPRALDGLTILHITDHHVARPQAGRVRFARILDALRRTPADLVVLTGDYMTYPGQERPALDALERIAGAWTARRGAYAIFGNHDSSLFRAIAHNIPGITWLDNATYEVPGLPLRVLGTSHPEDLLSLVLDPAPACPSGDPPAPAGAAARPMCLALAHRPNELFPAAQMNVPIVLCGHTHGGQIRLSSSLAPHTSTDLPADLACGIIRYRNTLCCISRGIGEAAVEIRINCPPQIPLYTLRHGPFPAPRRRSPRPGGVRPAGERPATPGRATAPPPPEVPVRIVAW